MQIDSLQPCKLGHLFHGIRHDQGWRLTIFHQSILDCMRQNSLSAMRPPPLLRSHPYFFSKPVGTGMVNTFIIQSSQAILNPGTPPIPLFCTRKQTFFFIYFHVLANSHTVNLNSNANQLTGWPLYCGEIVTRPLHLPLGVGLRFNP